EGAYFLDKAQQDQLTKVAVTESRTLNSRIVGKSARAIAEMAGISLPDAIRAMICPLDGVGRDFPLSMEKLSPILAYYVVDSLDDGSERCNQILRFGGMGHTASIHTQSRDAAREFGTRMPASRIVVNSPSTHGAIGFTTDLEPSMTLGCGSWGGNVTSDNISPRHLLDVKRIAFETRPVNQVPVVTAAPVRHKSAGRTIDRAAIAALVDRFLSDRDAGPRPEERISPAAAPQSGSSPAAAEQPRPPSPHTTDVQANGRVYDFVCEEDVRQAIATNQKIRINSKTIITPAARDLGQDKEVFSRA
ncbi:MAG TPA: hypothetical protein VFV34_03775, partial [Blastocatellia bacterium]|nr:hypothetical protein [Blastocatellia bacterium]